ncbi:putative prophage protein [Bacillus inaquosorum KCTC 13429]|uniref:Prophage protein n=1 Tax=Bacillus inaquosorum KCTC 13429 TaxID=1236548 RepID=A0A9W5PD98_9BACI|nr:putative prophage protein [Bacillus inaquosorum KCTC 13429]
MENEGRNLFCNRWELNDQEFFKDNSVVEGAVFANHLKTNQYYTIFVELQAYPFGQAVDLVQTYEEFEFVDSDYELVLLLADSSYVSIYCKDRNVIEKLFINALKNDSEEVQLITDDNDTRTGLTV